MEEFVRQSRGKFLQAIQRLANDLKFALDCRLRSRIPNVSLAVHAFGEVCDIRGRADCIRQ